MKTMAAEDWTEERVKILTEMWANGSTCSQIGARIGMSSNAVIGKRCRLGLPDRGEATLKYRSKGGVVPVRKPSAKRLVAPHEFHKLRDFEAKLKAAPNPEPKKQSGDAPAPLNLELIDLTEHACKFPVNDGGPFLFCGHEKESGVPYCPYHQRLAWAGRPVSRGTIPLRRAA